MRTIEDQALKLHDYMLKHWHKDIPLYVCLKALNKAENAIMEQLLDGEDICYKAGEMIMLAIDDLKQYKQKLHS